MIIEILLDNKATKSSFTPSISRFIDDISKIEGKNNYILTLRHVNKKMQDVKDFLEIANKTYNKLKEDKIEHTILINEANSVLLKKLYPLAQQFESKLRKFINIALCDTNEVLEKAFSSLKGSISSKMPHVDFSSKQNIVLEYSDLSNIYKFLFSDKQLVKYITDQKMINCDNWLIHSQIQNLKNTTIWNESFKEKYKDFHFDEYYEAIYNYRNDIMHFHNITFDNYIKARKLFNRAIKEIDKTLEQNVVLEIDVIFSNDMSLSSLVGSFYEGLSNWSKQFNKVLGSEIYKNLADFGSSFYNSITNSLNSMRSLNVYNSLKDIIDQNNVLMPTIQNPLINLKDEINKINSSLILPNKTTNNINNNINNNDTDNDKNNLDSGNNK